MDENGVIKETKQAIKNEEENTLEIDNFDLNSVRI